MVLTSLLNMYTVYIIYCIYLALQKFLKLLSFLNSNANYITLSTITKACIVHNIIVLFSYRNTKLITVCTNMFACKCGLWEGV